MKKGKTAGQIVRQPLVGEKTAEQKAREKEENMAYNADQREQAEKEATSYNQNTTHEMNYFAFETNVRMKIKGLLDPISTQQVEDRKLIEDFHLSIENFSNRLAWVEGIFE